MSPLALQNVGKLERIPGTPDLPLLALDAQLDQSIANHLLAVHLSHILHNRAEGPVTDLSEIMSDSRHRDPGLLLSVESDPDHAAAVGLLADMAGRIEDHMLSIPGEAGLQGNAIIIGVLEVPDQSAQRVDDDDSRPCTEHGKAAKTGKRYA
jgi:hypothetical protein